MGDKAGGGGRWREKREGKMGGEGGKGRWGGKREGEMEREGGNKCQKVGR